MKKSKSYGSYCSALTLIDDLLAIPDELKSLPLFIESPNETQLVGITSIMVGDFSKKQRCLYMTTKILPIGSDNDAQTNKQNDR